MALPMINEQEMAVKLTEAEERSKSNTHRIDKLEQRQDGNLYLYQRTGEAAGGTIVLQYLPHELVGQYFELAN